ncbi:hypothetical protein V8E51_004362 [Hyaloscypha variabilis]
MASQHLKLKPFALNPLAAVFEPMGDVAFERELPATEVIEGSAAPIDTLCVRSEPLTEFHPFPRLPSEIRLKIWKLGVPGDGRIVELKYSKKIFHAVSPTPTPVLMHVSRETRAEASKHYTLLYNPHYLTPRIYINPKIDTLYFSEKRGGQFNDVFQRDEDTYVGYFKIMTKNIQQCVLTDLRRIAIVDSCYLGNLDWDGDRQDAFHLTKFTNLGIASIVIDTAKKIDGPVKLVQVTWGACPIYTKLGCSRPDYDGDEVVHSCNLCGCPFIKEVLLELNIDHMLFEQLKLGLLGMFTNIEKKRPGWKVPKTKCMILTDKKRDIMKGSFEFRFKNPKLMSGRKPHIPEWADIGHGEKGVARMEILQPRSGSF